MSLEELRAKYPTFEFVSFKYEPRGQDLWLQWEFRMGDLVFHPELTIFGASEGAISLPKADLDNLVFHLGLADIFSYWKTTCSPEIKISAGSLNDDQISWWHDLLIKGMGQYFYTNQINFWSANFIKFTSPRHSGDPALAGDSRISNVHNGDSGQARMTGKVLIPVGGGKDSAVSLELLSKYRGHQNIGAFAMSVSKNAEVLPAAIRLAQTAGIRDVIKIQRTLDPQIFELREKGYLDGHIPFTAYLSFLSVLIAKLFGYTEITFSNERSSNEGNLEYHGHQINHQFSKSYEFEQLFREYNLRHLSTIRYLSFLRPLYELQIMKIFSTMNKYFTQFRSCNVGYKNDSWCGHCPKCLATFVGLFPFVKTEDLISILGKNIFEDETLLVLTRDVLGKGKGKPFECIGTFDETVAAFYLSLKKSGDSPLPPLLQYFQKEVLPDYPGIEKMSQNILTVWDDNHNLPTDYVSLLKNRL